MGGVQGAVLSVRVAVAFEWIKWHVPYENSVSWNTALGDGYER
jgi:hypothetical protein